MEEAKIKRRKMEDQNVTEKRDCLAELPEPLLHDILSCLTMKDVIRTCVLAKRWRYIWLYVPCLTFSPLKMTRSKELAFITQSLLLHKGPKVQKLNITFNYSTEALVLDSWIHFALTRNVNQLYLDFSRCNSYRSKYKLHDIVFSCSSLTVLALKSCIIKLPVKVKLRSLKTLSFEKVKFDGGAISDMLSCCSILEDLSFANCHLGNNPHLAIRNSGVKTLKIQGSPFSKKSKLEINAPFVVSFQLIGGLFSKHFVTKRMGSLCRASFVCSELDACCEQVYTNFSNLENLEYLRHVKDLRMCSCYIQAMSNKEKPTQDCREKHIMDFISFDVTCLRIKTGMMEQELRRIAYILSLSPNVETLIISVDKIQGNELYDTLAEMEYWKREEAKFVNLLCKLKDVKIYGFLRNLVGLESKHMSALEECLAHLRNNMYFLRFLLKTSKVMERMTITTVKNFEHGRNSESNKKLTKVLLAFPRASQAAQISFN
ncbi:hypothetical protein Vadar_025849 [Vaccinium darrowii]|uniref:Uncharacterized protein n=1 Tax=Vaccinium darrowii TaxID=229202 RepID=A0ACB7Z6C2_9ERIC|nr:hypothetical protein Vadar_025849 [Vaccinium darrowii]